MHSWKMRDILFRSSRPDTTIHCQTMRKSLPGCGQVITPMYLDFCLRGQLTYAVLLKYEHLYPGSRLWSRIIERHNFDNCNHNCLHFATAEIPTANALDPSANSVHCQCRATYNRSLHQFTETWARWLLEWPFSDACRWCFWISTRERCHGRTRR